MKEQSRAIWIKQKKKFERKEIIPTAASLFNGHVKPKKDCAGTELWTMDELRKVV